MKKMRVFAGPNGSGKTSLYHYLKKKYNCGCLINADEIKNNIDNNGLFDFDIYNITDCSMQEFEVFFNEHTINKSYTKIEHYKISDNKLINISSENVDTYFCAILADYCRNKALSQSKTFSCETVFSHPSKLELLRKAKDNGFKIYLYFVITGDPLISLERVLQRVQQNGHNVPINKIIERYQRSSNLLPEAVKIVDEYFIIKNDTKFRMIAENHIDNLLFLPQK